MGEFPLGLFHLPSLETIDLQTNSMSGNLPILLPSSLTTLDLRTNQFSSAIPTEWCTNLTNLVNLKLSNNEIPGDIPSCLGNMMQLEELYLHRNDTVRTIPTSLGKLPNLVELHLHRNNLSPQSMPLSICEPRLNPGAADHYIQVVTTDCLNLDSTFPTSPSHGGDATVFCPPGCCTLCCNMENQCLSYDG